MARAVRLGYNVVHFIDKWTETDFSFDLMDV